MIYDKLRNRIIVLQLNTTDHQGIIKIYDGETLEGSELSNFKFKATYMKDVYFIDDKTILIQDASGEKITLNTIDHQVGNLWKGQFPEIYLDPYFYSQPTLDTLFIYDKVGNHYLFNLGHDVAYIGQSGDGKNLMMVTPAF